MCQYRGHGFDPWVRKTPWRRKWQPTPVVLLEKFHGQRNLAGYSPFGPKESDMIERLTHTHDVSSQPYHLGMKYLENETCVHTEFF